MRRKARTASQPGIDGSDLVRTVVVHHQMHVQLRCHVGLDGARELPEFTAAMVSRQFANDFARSDQILASDNRFRPGISNSGH